MSTPSVPQYSDIELEFDNLQYNVDPSSIDLTAVDDIILSIAAGSPTNTPILTVKYTIEPLRFTIDNDAKSIKVQVYASEVTNTLGKYAANLWITTSPIYLTHLPLFFVVKPTVNYQ